MSPAVTRAHALPASSIDFARVLDDLALLLGEPSFAFPAVRESLNTSQLARALSVPRMTLVGWMSGQEPKHTQGEVLLVRWCSLTGKPREMAPRERKSLGAEQRYEKRLSSRVT